MDSGQQSFNLGTLNTTAPASGEALVFGWTKTRRLTDNFLTFCSARANLVRNNPDGTATSLYSDINIGNTDEFMSHLPPIAARLILLKTNGDVEGDGSLLVKGAGLQAIFIPGALP